jgi:hypothetical protein
MDQLRIRPVALATATFLMVSFVLDWFLALPTWGFERLLETLLPGYRCGRPGGFWWGLLASAVTGVYIAVVFVPLYHFFRARDGTHEDSTR